MFYLYAKLTDRADAFGPVLDALGLPPSELSFHSEHELAWHVLDDTIGLLQPGDGLCVPGLEHLGNSRGDIAARIGRVVSKGCSAVACSIPATYEFGLDPTLNRAVVSAVLQGMACGSAGQAPFMPEPTAGRPRLAFPPGWDELYVKWERAEITSKEFLAASGLKKATFYNKLADYRELLEFNARYLAGYGIA